MCGFAPSGQLVLGLELPQSVLELFVLLPNELQQCNIVKLLGLANKRINILSDADKSVGGVHASCFLHCRKQAVFAEKLVVSVCGFGYAVSVHKKPVAFYEIH